MAIVKQLMKRMRQADWQPLSICHDGYRLDLTATNLRYEVGFTLWRTPDGNPPQLVASGHTLHGALREGHQRPLELPAEVERQIATLLSQ